MTNHRYEETLVDPEATTGVEAVGRTHDLPGVRLAPLRTPLAEHIRRAPAGLKAQVAPLTPLEARLWELLKDPARLGTEAVAKVPIWIPELGTGYVVDFLLPQVSVAIVIEPPESTSEEEDPDEAARTEALMTMCDDLQEEGIETISFYPEWIEQDPEAVLEEIRTDLGFE
jgi:very-short-patch-repair endonuclease